MFTVIDLYKIIVNNFLSVAIVNSSMQLRFLTNRCYMISLTTCISESWFSIQNERNEYPLIARLSLIMIEKASCKSVSFALTFEPCVFDFDKLLKAEREAETLDLKSVEDLEKALNMWKAFMISDCSLSFDASLSFVMFLSFLFFVSLLYWAKLLSIFALISEFFVFLSTFFGTSDFSFQFWERAFLFKYEQSVHQCFSSHK